MCSLTWTSFDMGWHLNYLFSGLSFLLYLCIALTFSQSHIPPALTPASLNSGGSSAHPTGRVRSVEHWAQQGRNKENAAVILDGGRVMSQEEGNTSTSRTQEFVRMLSLPNPSRGLPSVHCQEQFPVLFFQPACQFCGERLGFHWWTVKFSWVSYLCQNV